MTQHIYKNLEQLVDMYQYGGDDFETVSNINVDQALTIYDNVQSDLEKHHTSDNYNQFIRRVSNHFGRMQGGKRRVKDKTMEDSRPNVFKKSKSKPVVLEEESEDFAFNETDVKSDMFDETESEIGFNDEEFYEQSRPRKRNKEADEAYKALDQKIIDVLDVDAETARVYKILAKHAVVTKNPELKKSSNDALKIKEIEKLITKPKLKALVKNIDLEELKAKIKERYAEAQKKREARKKQARHMNYLQSDEIIFSDDEY